LSNVREHPQRKKKSSHVQNGAMTIGKPTEATFYCTLSHDPRNGKVVTMADQAQVQIRLSPHELQVLDQLRGALVLRPHGIVPSRGEIARAALLGWIAARQQEMAAQRDAITGETSHLNPTQASRTAVIPTGGEVTNETYQALQIDLSRLTAGKLCARGHDYEGLGHSMLTVGKRVCPLCERLRRRKL
jgi:hypothetical protein